MLKKYLFPLSLTLALSLSPFSSARVLSQSLSDNLRQTYQGLIEAFPAQLEAARQSGQKWREADVLNSVGIAYLYFGEYDEAKNYFEQALGIARLIQDYPRELDILRMLATVSTKLGDSQGLNFLETEFKQTTDPITRKNLLYLLALAHLQEQNSIRAIEVLEDYLQTTLTPLEKVQGLQFLASAYQLNRQYTKAISTLQEALSIASSLDNTQYKVNIILAIAISYRYQDKVTEALNILNQALQFSQNTPDGQDEWSILGEMALLHLAGGNPQKAVEIQKERVKIADRLFILQKAMTLDDLGMSYFWANNLQEAIASAQETVKIYETFEQENPGGSGFSLANSLQSLGFFLTQANQLNAAETALKRAIQIFEIERQKVLQNNNLFAISKDQLNIFQYSSANDTYRFLQGVLVAQNRLGEALEISEQGRARAFVDLLVSRLTTDPKTQPQVKPPNLEEIKQIARREKTTLVQYSILYKYGRLYRYQVGENLASSASTLLIWVIKPTGELIFRQVPLENDIADLVKKGRQQATATTRRPNSDNSPLRQLYQILIAPIADVLPKNPEDHITFIPQDELFLVPFPALQDRTGTYLIDKHTIQIAPSIQVLDLARQSRDRISPQTHALVIGNPTMPAVAYQPNGNREQLSNLPGAETEAKEIAQLLDTEPILGAAATKANILAKIKEARFVHIATHGLLDNNSGYLSSLAFAPTATDDGLLTAREIFNLKLNANLVVLSACDTGRGSAYISGDGVVGLSRAFIGAGAASVIVSLWAIPDRPTATLMQQFYRNLTTGNDKAKALRQAMLTTKAEFPNPRDWGAFTLIGTFD